MWPRAVYIEADEFLDHRAADVPTAAQLAERYGNGGQRPADAMEAGEIHAESERMVFMVLSIRRSVRPAAAALAWFPLVRVTGLLEQIGLVTRTSLELAYHLMYLRTGGLAPVAG